jgi:hypothetical protein
MFLLGRGLFFSRRSTSATFRLNCVHEGKRDFIRRFGFAK